MNTFSMIPNKDVFLKIYQTQVPLSVKVYIFLKSILPGLSSIILAFVFTFFSVKQTLEILDFMIISLKVDVGKTMFEYQRKKEFEERINILKT